MNTKIYSLILDLFQASSIFYIFLSAPLVAANDVLVFLQAVAITIILEALWEMRRTKYYRVPDIGKQNELVKTGIYKYIRNPMYLAELLFCGVLVLNSYSPLRMTVFIILFVDLLLKIRYEEVLLGKYFKQSFVDWKKTSWRLLLFIF